MKFNPLALAMCLVLTTIATADQTLFDFSANPDTTHVKPKAATSFQLIDLDGGKAVQVKTTDENPYPGIRFQAPNGTWNLNNNTGIEIRITNLDSEGLKIGARIDNKGATGQKNSNTGSVTLAPGQTGSITVNFNRYFANDIREKLKARSYQGPRITELLKNTKASAAVSGAMAARSPAVEISPTPPVQVSRPKQTAEYHA